jgi:PIN domain nuclease of toxin-antitoxin system
MRVILPDHHRHPFDRLLISQVLLENLPVLSADSQLARYEVEVLG